MDQHTVSLWPAGAFSRLEVDTWGIIDATPQRVWDLFVEWSAIHRWMKPPVSAKEVVGSDLLPGQTEADLPRTRMIQYDETNGPEPAFAETLLHADPETRTLYYRVEGVRPIGYRNYLCYVTVDDHESGGAVLRINARMDAPSDVAKSVQTMLQTVHAQAIIQAFRDHLSKA